MTYQGQFISGSGNNDRLALIDKSFAALNASPTSPHLKMLYSPVADMFTEGFIWGNGAGWWIQNSYGFAMGAIPLLDEFWSAILQNSYDQFWDRIGDGKRVGWDSGVPSPDDTGISGLLNLCAPDGALGDAVFIPDGIAYRQGDGDYKSYDWLYEATAAGVNIQADILLFGRQKEKIRKYLPLMWRSLNHIESTRAENGLFLVGASANLLAPSYGGSYNEETGEIGKGYLTGLSVTYSSALRKCAELCRMIGDTEGENECRSRLTRNLEALPQLLTEEGYFAKSMDPDGTKHGVFGAEKYGYLESVCNVDAIAWKVVPPDIAESIYRKIASVPEIRGAGILCNNYPHLDDTLSSYRNKTSDPNSLGWLSGDWVDGGCWATVEGRAILAYLTLGKYDDAFKSADVVMRWAEEYRQDAPFSQWGHNTNNPWQRENDEHTACVEPVAIMIDNFAPITCLLRGLFDYTADADGLWITPRIPDDISELTQHRPISFNGCHIYITYKGGQEPLTACLNGHKLQADQDGRIFISAALLPNGGEVCLSVSRAGEAACIPAADIRRDITPTGDIEGVPAEMLELYRDCEKELKTAADPLRIARLREVLLSVEAAALRRRLPFDKHELRPMTEDKVKKILQAYDNTVWQLAKGLKYGK